MIYFGSNLNFSISSSKGNKPKNIFKGIKYSYINLALIKQDFELLIFCKQISKALFKIFCDSKRSNSYKVNLP